MSKVLLVACKDEIWRTRPYTSKLKPGPGDEARYAIFHTILPYAIFLA